MEGTAGGEAAEDGETGEQRALREYVQDRLAGSVRRPDGTIVAGPETPPWKGLNKPRRQDRRWSTAWSPEQIAHRLRLEFLDDESMRISHEAIYQSLFIQGRGALKRDLVVCLRTGRALREPRARSQNNPQGHVTADVVLRERPAEADDRAVPGHWEGDLIIGTADPPSAHLSNAAVDQRFLFTSHAWKDGARSRM